MEIIDLHMHTFFSDGVLSPAELVYRYKYAGAGAVAITDHADYSNIENLIASMLKAAPELEKHYGLTVLAGVELTYVPPAALPDMISHARDLGAEIVVVHGETSAENVPPGTNSQAIKGRCDILAHPGKLSSEEALMAAEKDVFIEITTRRGHRKTNRLVAEEAFRAGARMVIDTDTHSPEDLLDEGKIETVIKECGLKDFSYGKFFENSLDLVNRIIKERKK